MTSCADQCRFAGFHRKDASAYARAYSIAGSIVKQSADISAPWHGQWQKRDISYVATVVSQSTQSLYRNQRNRYIVYATTVICGYAHMVICQYANIPISQYANIPICQYPNMPTCGYAAMRLWSYANMGLGACNDMGICRYAHKSI